MDLFKEAQWTFEQDDKAKWYNDLILGSLVAPRMARFGGLTTTCAANCSDIVVQRTITGNPLALFADVGNMEYNNECRICLETDYDTTIKFIDKNIREGFGGLGQLVLVHNAQVPDTPENAAQKAENQRIAQNLITLSQTITANDVAEFYGYYVERGLYAQLGWPQYVQTYKANAAAVTPPIQNCISNFGEDACPTLPSEMNEAYAKRDLLRHADNAFSSFDAAGAPTPFWSGDGTGDRFRPNSETNRTYPLSGSGIDMSGEISSLVKYLGAVADPQGTLTADPTSDEWKTEVEINPLYAWFMASLTDADPGTIKLKCHVDIKTGRCHHALTTLLFYAFYHSLQQWTRERWFGLVQPSECSQCDSPGGLGSLLQAVLCAHVVRPFDLVRKLSGH